MALSEYLTDSLVFLGVAVTVVPLFQKLRSSPILGYLAAGVMIGPHGFSLIGDTEAARTLAEFGVVFLLFMIGLELSFGRLRCLGSKVFGLGTLQVLGTGVLVASVVGYLGYPIETALVIGGGLALSSTAFVLQLLQERGERASDYGLATFSILLLQDLAVVPLLVLVTLLGANEGSFLGAFGTAALKGGVVIAVVILAGRFLLKPFYRMIIASRGSELFVSTTLLVILGAGALMALAGLSMELGALLAGLLLAETEYRHQIEADIKPFRGILLGLFFMTIGMSVDIGFIFQNLAMIVAVVLALMAGKSLLIIALCRLFGLSFSVAIRTGFTLSQGGEFGFVLFGAALGVGLISPELSQLLMAVISLTMVATPLMVALGQRLGQWAEKPLVDTDAAFEPGPQGLDNPVLIAGFGRVGQTVARVLSDVGIPYVALDLDHKRVAKCREKSMAVFYGDADQLQVLEAAGAAGARAAVITLDQYESASRVVSVLRGEYPDLPIYVRARDRRHMSELVQAGASEVVSEAAEASLQLGGIVLAALDVGSDEIANTIQDYREDDYKRLDDIVGG